MTPAGRFDKRIAFQAFSAEEDALGGGEDGAWATVHSCAARVLYGTSAERRSAAAEQAVQTATFRVRATTETRAITVMHRIQFDGIAWDLTGVAPIGGPVPCEIEFTATAVRS